MIRPERRKIRDASGMRFGALTVLREWHDTARRCEVICKCGKIKIVGFGNLTRGDTKTCGKSPCRNEFKLPTIRRAPRKLDAFRDEIVRMYKLELAGTPTISKRIGFSQNGIKSALKRWGVRNDGINRRCRALNEIIPEKATAILNDYDAGKGLGAKRLARKYGIRGHDTVIRFLQARAAFTGRAGRAVGTRDTGTNGN